MEPCDALLSALCTRFGMQVVSKTSSVSQLRAMLRINPQHTRNWEVGMHHLLHAAERGPWTMDLSRQYFLREGALVWGWRIIFQHEDIASQVASITNVVNTAPRARFEVEEQQLPGVTGQRSIMNERGKGASVSGSPPLLIRSRMGMVGGA